MRFRRFAAVGVVCGLGLLTGCPYSDTGDGLTSDGSFTSDSTYMGSSAYADPSVDSYDGIDLTSLDWLNSGAWDYGWDLGDGSVTPSEPPPPPHYDILDLKSGKIRR